MSGDIVYNIWADPSAAVELDRLNAEIKRLRAEVERLTADPTIYKHQCGHCSRFSPLPFLIPGYLIGGQP